MLPECLHAVGEACDDMTPRYPAGAAQSELSRGVVIRKDRQFRDSSIPNEGSPQDRVRAHPVYGRPGVSGALRHCRAGAVDVVLEDGCHYHLTGSALGLLRAAGLRPGPLRKSARLIMLVSYRRSTNGRRAAASTTS